MENIQLDVNVLIKVYEEEIQRLLKENIMLKATLMQFSESQNNENE